MGNMRLNIASLLCLLLLLSGCSEYSAVLKSSDYEYKYEAAKALYADGHCRQAAEIFVTLIGTLRGTQYGEECLYMTAESNLRASDYETAAIYFKRYYQSYPNGRYAEMARYNCGYSLYRQTVDVRLDQTTTMEAIKEFQNFLDYVPNTNLKQQTQHIIFELQDKLVQKEYLAAKLYFDLGDYGGTMAYGGNNYEACVVTAQNALKDYPYASATLREDLSILSLRAKHLLATQSIEEKAVGRYRDVIDEYYAFTNDFPESKFIGEANRIFSDAEKAISTRGATIEEDMMTAYDVRKRITQEQTEQETKDPEKKNKKLSGRFLNWMKNGITHNRRKDK